MHYFIISIAYFLYYLAFALDVALLIRVVLSWFDPEEDGLLCRFVCTLTDPLLAVCQKLLDLTSIRNDGPFDLSFFLAIILISVLRMSLGAVI